MPETTSPVEHDLRRRVGHLSGLFEFGDYLVVLRILVRNQIDFGQSDLLAGAIVTHETLRFNKVVSASLGCFICFCHFASVLGTVG